MRVWGLLKSIKVTSIINENQKIIFGFMVLTINSKLSKAKFIFFFASYNTFTVSLMFVQSLM